MSLDIDSCLLMKIKPCINILQFTSAHAVNTWLLLMLVNEKLKSARNEHKNEIFYAYENIVHHIFFPLCRIYAIIAIKNDFVIHLHLLMLH